MLGDGRRCLMTDSLFMFDDASWYLLMFDHDW